jgi:2-haloacid dehalogenase
VTRVLFFDVFGTVVDWRSGILGACRAVSDRTGISADWAAVTDDWRRAYPAAMLAARGRPEWQNLDQLQTRTLGEVLARHGVDLPPAERADLVRAWRRLPPWPDSRAGLDRLSRTFTTATLSNGHVALLVDLLKFGALHVDAVLSAELVQSYKPDAVVYHRAAELMECPPEEAGMVAAHGSDLEAAAAVGFRPVFVRRSQEWGPDSAATPPPDLPGLLVVDDLGEIVDALR